MRPQNLILFLSTLIACSEKDDDDDEPTEEEETVDADGDGSPAGEDCDDADATAFPGNEEVCDEVDNNCDGEIDEGTTTTFFTDADGDGFGDADAAVEACEIPADAVGDDTDCDDADAAVNPDADEVCDDVDNNCDGEVDEDSATDAPTWYVDSDGDGYGDPDNTIVACEAPSDGTADGSDCDDADAAIHPGATEICNGVDEDCDAGTDEAGLVSWEDAAGTITDLTADLTGTASTPATFTAVDEGTLWFCDGTYYANIDAEAPLTIASLSGDASLVTLDGGATDSIVYAEADFADVTVRDVTLTNGYSAGRGVYGSSGGAVYCVSEASAGVLELDGVTITDNAADIYGGGVFSYGCDVTLTDTVIEDNDAEVAGGMGTADATAILEGVEVTGNTADSLPGWYQENGAVTATDVLIADNVAPGFGGGLWVYNGDVPGLAVSLDEVVVRDNEGEYIGGAGFHSSTVTWIGSETTDSGATGNISDEGGGVVLVDSTATFALVDFGTTAGGDDNDLADIYLENPERPYRAGDDASFSCDDDGCGSESTADIGDSTGSNSASWLATTAMLADKDATLHAFELYLDPGSQTCTADFYVLSSATGTGSWDLEWSSLDQPIASGEAFYASGDVDMILEDGTYYALGAAWDCGLTYYFNSSVGAVTDDMIAGTSTRSHYTSTVSEVTSSVTMTDTTTTGEEDLRLYTRITATAL